MQQDVLCGRGGMSNHHPGNEWYRRLIRSNRPLYRACPKHTKLLVAKAIVQAVEQQNGRFLERDKASGDWYTISYKRAVDKTSQGLREKDRELDCVDEAKKEAYKKRENASGLTGRKSKAPTLADMTKGVIVRATSSQYALPARQVGSGRPTESSISVPSPKQAKQATQKQKPASRVTLKQQLPLHQNQAAKAAPQPALNRTGSAGLDFTPLPPTLQIRQSSMYRNLKGTGLLPANSQALSPAKNKSKQPRPILPKVNNNGSGSAASSRSGSAAMPAPATNTTNVGAILQQQNLLLQQHQQNMLNNNVAQMPQQFNNVTMVPTAPAAVPRASSGVVPMVLPYGSPEQWQLPGSNSQAPELTRFTSQVSDWLNSFWPMDGSSGAGRQQSAPQMASLGDEEPSEEAIAAVAGRPLQQNKPEEAAVAVEEDSKPAAVDEPVVPRAAKPNKRKTSFMPPLPYSGGGGGGGVAANFEIPLDGMPATDLEHSVSATLLQLASSPTKLFSGLTSYFADDLDNEESGTFSKKRRNDGDNINSEVSSKKRHKKRDSLLDDYEETPMEARIRQVQYA